MEYELREELGFLKLKNFKIKRLEIKSKALEANPLKDPVNRSQFILEPLEKNSKSCVFILPAFTSKPTDFFISHYPKRSFVESLDSKVSQKKAPLSYYVFVDGMSALGGSQYLNSDAVGQYETYFIKEVLETFKSCFKTDPNKQLVTGASSGGYAALRLSALYPELFPFTAAIAPDSDFRSSLIYEFYKTLPYIQSYGGFKKVKDLLVKNELSNTEFFHDILNVIAMSACYLSNPKNKGEFLFPFDEDGIFNEEIFKKMEEYDLIHILPQMIPSLKKLKGIYLSVGKHDEFLLQYGSRKIEDIFKENSLDYVYEEFEGGHFGLKKRFDEVFKWLLTKAF